MLEGFPRGVSPIVHTPRYSLSASCTRCYNIALFSIYFSSIFKRVPVHNSHTEKSFRNLIKSTRNQTVFTIFQQIWTTTARCWFSRRENLSITVDLERLYFMRASCHRRPSLLIWWNWFACTQACFFHSKLYLRVFFFPFKKRTAAYVFIHSKTALHIYISLCLKGESKIW